MKPITSTILMIALAISTTFAQQMKPEGNSATVKEVDNGYLFNVALQSAASMQTDIKAIEGARIEVFNNTTDEEVLFLENHTASNFEVHFEKGNHYTIMVRKEGYFNKRMEAYVNVKGCILCFEGIGNVQPAVADAMTGNNKKGALIADVSMEPIELNRIIQIENIYYDLDKWFIRPDAAKELDKVITVLRDHPSIVMELGSHTDARGRDEYNKTLSEKRAQSAVEYILTHGNISEDRIVAKGYGETSLTNNCGNGVRCNDRKHQQNRRTELKITAIKDAELISYRSLSEIIKGERMGAQPTDRIDRMGTSDF